MHEMAVGIGHFHQKFWDLETKNTRIVGPL